MFFEITPIGRIAGRTLGNATGEVIMMTTKELLYVEDALGHEQYFQTKCRELAGQLQDADLKSCVERMEQKHQKLFHDFYGLL